MSATEEKKFVIKHVFTDFKNLEMDEEHRGNQEYHFDVPWYINCCYDDIEVGIYLFCRKLARNEEHKVGTEVQIKVGKQIGGLESTIKNLTFSHCQEEFVIKSIAYKDVDDYLIDGNLEVECQVKIKKMTGIQECSRRFDESAKDFSDVTLMVGAQKFYVLKHYLASHSTYFKALLLGNFDESKQSEVELKDIAPFDFQNFLELIHGEPAVNEDTLAGILKLADFFDSKTAFRQCEKFLLIESKEDLKSKFQMATEYKLEKLTKKCISEMKTASDIRSAIPADLNQFDNTVWNELLLKALSLIK